MGKHVAQEVATAAGHSPRSGRHTGPTRPTAPHGPAPPRTERNDHKGIDGRIARSLRTTDHIVEALLDLLERDGDLRPTVHQVADRAGVSRRAVYLHFDSLEELLATAIARRATEVCSTWPTPPYQTSLDERIDWFTHHWSVLTEALRPLRRAAAVHEPFSPQLHETFDRARQWARGVVELVFLPELQERSAHDRAPLRTALHHVTSWSGWDDLHRQGADAAEAGAAVRLLLHALLTPPDRMAHFCSHGPHDGCR